MTTLTNTTDLKVNSYLSYDDHPADARTLMRNIGGKHIENALEPFWLEANPETKKLKFELTAAPLCISVGFWDWLLLVIKPMLKGKFEGLKLIDVGFQYPVKNDMYRQDSPCLTIIMICYQLDSTNKIIEHAHDVEISINWHKSLTKTNDAILIEKLFSDMCEIDFSIEQLDHYLTLLGDPTE